MMKTRILAAVAVLAVLGGGLMSATAPVAYAASAQEGIAAVVNQGVITHSDVNERMRLVMASSGLPNNDDVRTKIRPQILNMLIDEALQLQEAKRLDIEVTPEEVESGIDMVAQNNKIDPATFRKMLAGSGIKMSTMADQVRSQMAWGKVIQKKLRPKVNVSETDIDARLNFIQSSAGKMQYLVGEIFLPVDNPAEDGSVRQLAQKLTAEIAAGKAPFPQVAAQFSQGPSAARGGDIGWVQEGQLPEALDQALATMKEGDMSQPLRSLTGYHILLVRSKRTLSADDLPSRDDIAQKIGTETLDRLQRRYLLDLKSEAFIERRV